MEVEIEAISLLSGQRCYNCHHETKEVCFNPDRTKEVKAKDDPSMWPMHPTDSGGWCFRWEEK